jgi:homoserine O-acetyltransferase/O-succinyltransferase
MLRRLIPLLFFLSLPAFAGEQHYASLGDFVLDSGQIIRECRIGYRVDGTLDEKRSNVVVLTTWFGGKSEGLAGWIGPGRLFDTNRWYVVSIDAFGDGISSSPSNSVLQPGAKFPQFSMRDLVRSQHQLLTRHLKFDRVYAVAGLSMGGMQAMQWAVSYPDFMEKVVSIVGTPRQTASDLILWRTQLDLLESFRDSPESMKKAMHAIAGIGSLELWTPAYLARTIPAAGVDKHLASRRKSIEANDPWDYMSQLRAMIAHDIGPDAEVAKKIRAKMLIVVALQDEMVNPGPSRELAATLGARLVTLSGDCGHLASGCEREVLTREVAEFLRP